MSSDFTAVMVFAYVAIVVLCLLFNYAAHKNDPHED